MFSHCRFNSDLVPQVAVAVDALRDGLQGVADAHRIATGTRPLRIAVERIIALRKIGVAGTIGARVTERADVARSWRYHLAFGY